MGQALQGPFPRGRRHCVFYDASRSVLSLKVDNGWMVDAHGHIHTHLERLDEKIAADVLVGDRLAIDVDYVVAQVQVFGG